jgi:hypothetical protein
MIVRPHNKIEETTLSTTDEFRSSPNPKNKIRKLITAKEKE